MLLRSLAQVTSEEKGTSWNSVINSVVNRALAKLPTALKTVLDQDTKSRDLQLKEHGNNPDPQAQLDIDRDFALNAPLWDQLWLGLGALALLGGYVDTLRVGTRVHLKSEGSFGTAISRALPTASYMPLKKDFKVIVDGEGSVKEVKLKDITVLGDIPFSRDVFHDVCFQSNILDTCIEIFNLTSMQYTNQQYYYFKIGRAVQQECRDRSRMPSSA
eukprot:TRINITY_DN15599_c0_g1_i1.p1 TRINITY_DN15599_c0_g1~~TRINITY_DN15599_c0_g1_i1.p1  ORF type:complete len:244 (+),score=34.65 TRINITY_DN15599_c0_g1_i1:86-733(+)